MNISSKGVKSIENGFNSAKQMQISPSATDLEAVIGGSMVNKTMPHNMFTSDSDESFIVATSNSDCGLFPIVSYPPVPRPVVGPFSEPRRRNYDDQTGLVHCVIRRSSRIDTTNMTGKHNNCSLGSSWLAKSKNRQVTMALQMPNQSEVLLLMAQKTWVGHKYIISDVSDSSVLPIQVGVLQREGVLTDPSYITYTLSLRKGSDNHYINMAHISYLVPAVPTFINRHPRQSFALFQRIADPSNNMIMKMATEVLSSDKWNEGMNTRDDDDDHDDWFYETFRMMRTNSLIPKDVFLTETSKFKPIPSNEQRSLLALESQDPTVHEDGSPYLNLMGRGCGSSNKNMQLVVVPGSDFAAGQLLKCQMSKWDKHMFHIDFRHPMTAFHAFGFALAQLDL